MKNNKITLLQKTFLQKLLLLVLSAGFVLSLAACTNSANDDKGGQVLVTSVSIKKSLTVTSGDTYQFEATVLPEDATDKTVKFTVDSKDYATVIDKDIGKIKFNNTGNKEATVKVKCTAQDGSKKTATCTVTVNLALPPVYEYKRL